jgi:hypothetical protein
VVSPGLFDHPARVDPSREALLASQPERRLAAVLALVVTPLALLASVVLVVKMPPAPQPVGLPIRRAPEPAPRVEPALASTQPPSEPAPEPLAPLPASAPVQPAAPLPVLRAVPTEVEPPARGKKGSKRSTQVHAVAASAPPPRAAVTPSPLRPAEPPPPAKPKPAAVKPPPDEPAEAVKPAAPARPAPPAEALKRPSFE